MLVLTRERDGKILIGDDIAVQVVDIRGDKVRLGIEAPPDVRIDRPEVRASKDAERVSQSPFRMLSLWQPWASLLVGGVKRIETRSWARNYTGWLFIHASRMPNGKFAGGCARDLAWNNKDAFAHLGVAVNDPNWFDLLPRGAIVGAVKISECVASETLVEEDRLTDLEESLGDFGPDRYGWLTIDHRLFKNPVPVVGGQQLRTLPDDVLQACVTQLGASRLIADTPPPAVSRRVG